VRREAVLCALWSTRALLASLRAGVGISPWFSPRMMYVNLSIWETGLRHKYAAPKVPFCR
jgi:hypothetical protein